eukprot:TRINITY_DN5015_c0_g1_i2.p1 TRINITY_DN5015_c0_g1~~TRINITY_DN5015_c0_g1_i2.p1  ORF type:complete len:267 (+),score=41.34 TRINITY_DN5015_c0_g1_i2:31-801(+)
MGNFFKRKVVRIGSSVYEEVEPEGTIVSLSETEFQELSAALERLKEDLAFITARLYGDKILRKPKRNTRLKPWMTNNIFYFCVVWQILTVIILTVFDHKVSKESQFEVGLYTCMGTLQFVLAVVIVVISIKLCKQVLHRTVTFWFLSQSYLSTIVLFSGIYTIIFRINGASFSGVWMSTPDTSEWRSVRIFVRMFYFSTTTMTAIGYGDITPDVWYTDLIVTMQLLLTVVYTTVVFALGLQHFNRQTLVKKVEPIN